MSKSQMPIPETLLMKESMLTKKKIPIAHKQTKRQQQYFFTTVGILFIVCLLQIDISFPQFQEGVARIPTVLSMMLQMSFTEFPGLASEMVVSLVTAFLSLVLSIVFAVVLAFLAARNTTPNRHIGMLLRFLFMIIRAIPATVWVLIAVASIRSYFPNLFILSKVFFRSNRRSGPRNN